MLAMSNSSLMPCEERRRRRAFRGAWLLCFLATAALPAVADTLVEVTEASVALDDGVYELQASVDVELPEDGRRAIEAGLTLRLDYQIEIARVRRYLPDEGVASLLQRFELSYHALSQRYLVRNLNTGEQYDHGTLQGALGRMTEVRGLPLLDSSLLQPGSAYEFSVRADLRLRSLPDSLKWLVFWADDWSATSEWYRWTLRR